MSMREVTSSDRARRSTKQPVRESTCASFSSVRGGNEVKDDYKKRALERQCSNARCIGEGGWRYFFLPLYRSFIPSMTALVKLSEGSAKSTLSPCFETIME